MINNSNVCSHGLMHLQAKVDRGEPNQVVRMLVKVNVGNVCNKELRKLLIDGHWEILTT